MVTLADQLPHKAKLNETCLSQHATVNGVWLCMMMKVSLHGSPQLDIQIGLSVRRIVLAKPGMESVKETSL